MRSGTWATAETLAHRLLRTGIGPTPVAGGSRAPAEIEPSTLHDVGLEEGMTMATKNKAKKAQKAGGTVRNLAARKTSALKGGTSKPAPKPYQSWM